MDERAWEIWGPAKATLTVKEVANLFGYEERTFREYVRRGDFPRPRGFGHNEYYTGLDVAIMREMAGRWRPAEDAPEEAHKEPQTAPKRRRTATDSHSETDEA